MKRHPNSSPYDTSGRSRSDPTLNPNPNPNPKPEPAPSAEERGWVDKMLDDPAVRKGFLTELARQHEHAIRAAEEAMQERCMRAVFECSVPSTINPIDADMIREWMIEKIRALSRTMEKEEPK